MSLDAGAGDSGLVFARRQNLAGQAGEHYVLSRLLLEGVPAAVAPPGLRGVDVLVFDPDGRTPPAGVQVKASNARGRGG